MTKPQRISLMVEWWPNACRAQGWDEDDRAFRLEYLSKILGRQLNSTSELNNTTDIDTVKTHLLKLSDNLAATAETINPAEGRARRLRDTIRNELLKCLGVYHEDPEALLAGILRDKFQHGARSGVLVPITIDDLTDDTIEAGTFRKDGERKQPRSDLEQVLWAVARILRQHRQEAGDTEHEMRMKAGVRCDCARCTRPAVVEPEPEPVTVEYDEPF